MDDDALSQWTLVLENEGRFYKEFVAEARRCITRDVPAYALKANGNLRDLVRRWCSARDLAAPSFGRMDRLIDYFVDRYRAELGVEKPTPFVHKPIPAESWEELATHYEDSSISPNQRCYYMRHEGLMYEWRALPDGNVWHPLDPRYKLGDFSPLPPTQPTQPQPTQLSQEITMTTNTTPIVIKTQTLINGVDVSTLSDSAIYERIASEEAKIADLEKIQAKPQRLHKEIETRRAGIQALVTYLDSKAD